MTAAGHSKFRETVKGRRTTDAGAGDPDFMTSLARGLAVFRCFAEQRKPMTIAQTSQRTGIPRASVRRCLHTLVKLGYAVQDLQYFSLQSKTLPWVTHIFLRIGCRSRRSRYSINCAKDFVSRARWQYGMETRSVTSLDPRPAESCQLRCGSAAGCRSTVRRWVVFCYPTAQCLSSASISRGRRCCSGRR
jgi:IclR helix-turn-helix domain